MTHEDMSQNAEGYPTVDTPETEIPSASMAYDPSRGVSPGDACVIRTIPRAAASAAGWRRVRKVTGSSIRVPEYTPAS